MEKVWVVNQGAEPAKTFMIRNFVGIRHPPTDILSWHKSLLTLNFRDPEIAVHYADIWPLALPLF